MKLLITGGAGFIGSHFIRHILSSYPSYQVINLDKLTYAGNLKNCEDYVQNPQYKFVNGDITDASLVDELAAKVDVIINFAAETHVDNSIKEPAAFIKTNVLGTQILLDAARRNEHERFVQISTDEVYGDIEEGLFTEQHPLKPSSPYSASKASAEMLCLAYKRTYGMPVLITRCSNNYGTHQFPEKLIPYFIKKLVAGEKVPVYGNGENVRDWLHVTDHCKAIDLVLHKGKLGEVYNIGGNQEYTNLEITNKLLEAMGYDKDKIEHVQDRPGHDLRYAIDANKIKKELGWEPKVDFEQGFKEMVEWYRKSSEEQVVVSE